ncbi:hypothetical protein NQ317_010288 [Molorchus minor]|uniref:Uncharacterized protein n=1 Tax=Molorchus minor TaxID=1323400 RepID=A0ABQ9IYT8_9CUCU|nr:hypothetical protein NQ317_010288 [Molorchus minor]
MCNIVFWVTTTPTQYPESLPPCEETCDNTPSIACESSTNPLMMSSLSSRGHVDAKVTVATQTGHEAPDFSFNPDKMTVDKHCYECKVRYRDPKPQDLVMYLHAWKYREE